jgi:environmental stress-induced protein Ves
MSRVRVLRPADYRRMRWKNGGGWTTEIAVSPADAAEFDWRVSIAEIDSDGPFSPFPGCERYIALLDGAGMQLDFDGGDAVRLDQRLRFHTFSGDNAAHGRLISGPVRDFNVIARRARARADVLHRPLVGPMVFLPETAATWLIHLVGGQATVKQGELDLAQGDTLLIEPGEAAHNVVLTGGGEVVLVKFSTPA